MSNSIGQNPTSSPYSNYGSSNEAEAKAISAKQQRDILDNGWLGAEMKNVNDMLQKSKGQ
ncbi:hypothetical protein [Pseudomonas sp. NIBRBAC000502773]|uniref:hypothetical protein n=1 Tax=Pseudomonas sp. NIBRBAC000502773 TaxID=2590776 RepID=UPI0011328B89|nr:hypothetical protein [Pseudomonas sp. NIBRBAC000502773]QDG58563.1 hypothetical protein NIBR502773_19200 [Pseudomonas sp. NIBRBAC000502773]